MTFEFDESSFISVGDAIRLNIAAGVVGHEKDIKIYINHTGTAAVWRVRNQQTLDEVIDSFENLWISEDEMLKRKGV